MANKSKGEPFERARGNRVNGIKGNDDDYRNTMSIRAVGKLVSHGEAEDAENSPGDDISDNNPPNTSSPSMNPPNKNSPNTSSPNNNPPNDGISDDPSDSAPNDIPNDISGDLSDGGDAGGRAQTGAYGEYGAESDTEGKYDFRLFKKQRSGGNKEGYPATRPRPKKRISDLLDIDFNPDAEEDAGGARGQAKPPAVDPGRAPVQAGKGGRGARPPENSFVLPRRIPPAMPEANTRYGGQKRRGGILSRAGAYIQDKGLSPVNVLLTAALIIALIIAAVNIFQLNALKAKLAADEAAIASDKTTIAQLQRDNDNLSSRIGSASNGLSADAQNTPTPNTNAPASSPSQSGPGNTAPAASSPAAQPTAPSGSQTAGGTYTVVGGDNLTKICRKLNCNMQQLLDANSGLTPETTIFPGDKLNIPG